MLQVIRGKWMHWFFLVLVLALTVEFHEEAEAGIFGGFFRGGVFGRRQGRNQPRRRARVAKNKGNRNRNRNRNVARNRNRNRNNDQFNLDVQPVNALSSLNVNPTGDLQRLAEFNNLAVNRNGQVFELNNGNILDARQPLVLSNGQIIGGSLGGMLPGTIDQVRLLNESGNFRTLNR